MGKYIGNDGTEKLIELILGKSDRKEVSMEEVNKTEVTDLWSEILSGGEF